MGLIIGLGAQSLIADILGGIAIIFEEEFQVGDIIIVDGWRGTVQEIGIRCTKIMDAGGNIKVINNSTITTIVNETRELSVAKVVVGIAYDESIDRVEKIINDAIPQMKKDIKGIIKGPFYKGISELADSSVNLLILANCHEEDIYQVQRDLNRAILVLFNKNSVNIPFNQIVVNQPSKK